jgi:O-antigen ligase
MQGMNSAETKRRWTIQIRRGTSIGVFCVLIALLLIGRLYRGLYSSGFGGFWNYIEIAFVGLGIITFLAKINFIIYEKSISLFFTFSIYAQIVSGLRLHGLSYAELYEVIIVPYAVCTLILFYFFGRKSDFESDYGTLVVTYYILAFLSILAMFRFRTGIMLKGDGANVYYVLGLTPIVLAKTKKRKIIPIIVLFVAIVLTGKRAGLLAAVAMLIAYYLIQAAIRSSYTQTLKVIFSLIFITLALYFVMKRLDAEFGLNIIDRLEKLNTDGGSGRDIRWQYAIGLIRQSSLLELLFGNRMSFSGITGGLHVHNDFLEILFDYGVIGIILYILFYLYLIKEAISMVKNKYTYSGEFAASIIISLFLALFSFYFIDDTYIVCGMICYGLILSDWRRYREENQIVK